MTPTERKAADAAIRRFFDAELLPLSERRRAQRRQFFPHGPDKSATSYYIQRKQTTMSPADFHIPGCESIDAFEKAMVEFWKSQGDTDLASLAPSLARLARLLHERDEPTDEISPLIYVMF